MNKKKFKKIEKIFLNEFKSFNFIGVDLVEDPDEYIGEVHWLISILKSTLDKDDLSLKIEKRIENKFELKAKHSNIFRFSSKIWEIWQKEVFCN